MKKNDKNIFIVVTHIIKKENGQYVAVCPEFNVSSFGDTVEEANENLKEAITLYLEGIDELKIRDQVFKEKSIKTYTGRQGLVKKHLAAHIPVNWRFFHCHYLRTRWWEMH
jgi:predicted RNase H-like HicB family nuclease